MRLNPEQTDKASELVFIMDYVKNINENAKNKSGRGLMQDILSDIQPLLNKVGLQQVSEFLELNHHDFAKKVTAFQTEILFSINEEIETLDPAAHYRLMSKKVSDTTGYEYQRYLEFLEKKG